MQPATAKCTARPAAATGCAASRLAAPLAWQTADPSRARRGVVTHSPCRGAPSVPAGRSCTARDRPSAGQSTPRHVSHSAEHGAPDGGLRTEPDVTSCPGFGSGGTLCPRRQCRHVRRRAPRGAIHHKCPICTEQLHKTQRMDHHDRAMVCIITSLPSAVKKGEWKYLPVSIGAEFTGCAMVNNKKHTAGIYSLLTQTSRRPETLIHHHRHRRRRHGKFGWAAEKGYAKLDTWQQWHRGEIWHKSMIYSSG